MSTPESFYVTGPDDTFISTPSTLSAWGTGTQHGGPPSALLAHAIETHPDAAGRVLGRVTVDLLGPVPVVPLAVSTHVVRAGRSVALIDAVLAPADQPERPVARASAWLFPPEETGLPAHDDRLPHGPMDGALREFPPLWTSGYLDATEWRWHTGWFGTGVAVVWMRPRVPLLDERPWSPIPRIMALVDSASGVSSALDISDWRFLNTELSVSVLRPPVGDWLCLDATTTLSAGSVGIAHSWVYDEQGLVARSTQTLLIAPVSR